MKKDLVSIIIPVYNAGSFIMETLNSIIIQTYKNYEAIIIDDGSTDSTSLLVEKLVSEDKRFKYFYQENAGVSMARNKGIESSTGKYICFLDADDYFEDTYLEKMYLKISKEDSDICYCGYNIIINNSSNRKKTKFKNGDILLDKLLGKINIHTTGWMIKKEFLEKNKIKFKKDISWGEDFEFFNELVATTNRVTYIDEYLTNYVVEHSEEQLSKFSLDKIDKDFESIMRTIKNKKINRNKIIEDALIGYRLQGMIIYRLILAFNKGIDTNEIKRYYEKYSKYINKTTYNNGLRSIKLNLHIIKLKYLLHKNN